MIAIVEIAGTQVKVSKGDKIQVPLLESEVNTELTFDKIFLVENDGEINIGSPTIEGNVKATVLNHIKDKKVLVFHKKRRKGYQKMNGHRQKYSQIEITDITIN